MKTSSNLFASISVENLKSLTSVVTETVAQGVKNAEIKAFKAVDLWRIQSLRKSASRKRMFA